MFKNYLSDRYIEINDKITNKFHRSETLLHNNNEHEI